MFSFILISLVKPLMENEKHVGFSIEGIENTDSDNSQEEQKRPGRLHRQNTPHHLKNKRITSATKSADLEKVASIIAQVSNSLDWSKNFVFVRVEEVCSGQRRKCVGDR